MSALRPSLIQCVWMDGVSLVLVCAQSVSTEDQNRQKETKENKTRQKDLTDSALER